MHNTWMVIFLALLKVSSNTHSCYSFRLEKGPLALPGDPGHRLILYARKENLNTLPILNQAIWAFSANLQTKYR